MPYAKGKRPSRAKPPEQRQKRGPKPGQRHSGQFQPGETGNAGGVPRTMLELRALLIDEGTPKRAAEAVARGLACAAGLAPKTPGGKKYVDPYAIEKLTRLVWEFAYGKPDQPVTVSKKFEKMSDAEVLAELLKAAPPEARAAALAGVEVPQAVPASTPTPSSAALPGEPGRRIEGA